MRMSAAEARRVAVGAAGLNRPRPRKPDRRHLARLVDDVHVIQLDSVNVLARAHDLCVFSRVGPHPRHLLGTFAYRDRMLTEAWCHEASLVPTSDLPLLRWRQQQIHPRWLAWFEGKLRLVDAVLEEIRDRGALTAGQLSVAGKSRGPWWGWSDAKAAVEFLFMSGGLAVSGRTGTTGFERAYDLPERVVPRDVLDAPTPTEEEARAALLVRAARSLGVATAADLADYHRQQISAVRHLLPGLVEDRRLVPVQVEGWNDQAYMHPTAGRPRRATARALLSPFDPLVWYRRRAERLFGFHYRIEIYTPQPKRVYGYYVLPFVLGDRFVARIDLKADRKSRALLVRAAHGEDGIDVDEVTDALADELTDVATWLDLDTIVVEGRGDLAPALVGAVEAVA